MLLKPGVYHTSATSRTFVLPLDMAAVWHMLDSDGQHCDFRMGLKLMLETSDVLLEHCKHQPWQVCPACLV